jgi:hypothetical protein
MKQLTLQDIVMYKGSLHTFTALENLGNGKILVVLTNSNNKQIRLKHTTVESLIKKGEIWLNSESKASEAKSKASSSTKKQKQAKSRKNS